MNKSEKQLKVHPLGILLAVFFILFSLLGAFFIYKDVVTKQASVEFVGQEYVGINGAVTKIGPKDYKEVPSYVLLVWPAGFFILGILMLFYYSGLRGLNDLLIIFGLIFTGGLGTFILPPPPPYFYIALLLLTTGVIWLARLIKRNFCRG